MYSTTINKSKGKMKYILRRNCSSACVLLWQKVAVNALYLPTYEPMFEWYKANKIICCVCISSRLFLPSRLWWQLPSMMTVVVLTPLHRVSFLWWPWWRQWPRLSRRWCPPHTHPTHLDASPKQSFCIHVTRFVMLPLLINISSLFTRSQQPLHVWLSWKDELCLWGVLVSFHMFLIKVFVSLTLIQLQVKGWEVLFFIDGFIMWASWHPLTMKLWLMALQINLTWPETLYNHSFFSPVVSAGFDTRRHCAYTWNMSAICYFIL